MELCDEAGFYVLDEIPSCWVANEVNNASRTWAYTFRSKETLDRDKNRACVVAWSCGNESGYGVNNQAEFDYVKAHDPTRLAFISQQNLDKNPKTDFEDYHYPPIASHQGHGHQPQPRQSPRHPYRVSRAERRPADVADNWDVIWPTDGIAGAFIWEWQDQGMPTSSPSAGPSTAPVSARQLARSDPRNGIPPPTSRPACALPAAAAPSPPIARSNPLYWNLKMVYSPVNTTAREVAPAAGQCVVPLQNRYSFTDLSELTCRWQALAGEKVLASGESHIAAKPRSTVDASFPATAGMDTLRLEFIHPDGRSVYAARLHVKGYQGPAAPAALAATGPVRLSETDQNVVIQSVGAFANLPKLDSAYGQVHVASLARGTCRPDEPAATVIEYRKEENRILQEQLGLGRVQLNIAAETLPRDHRHICHIIPHQPIAIRSPPPFLPPSTESP